MPDNRIYHQSEQAQRAEVSCTSAPVFIALPKRFLRALEKAGSERELSRRLGVNIYYISKLLTKGIEPTNPEIRAKLFLPRRKRKPRAPVPEAFPGQKRIKKAIRKMRKDTEKAIKGE